MSAPEAPRVRRGVGRAVPWGSAGGVLPGPLPPPGRGPLGAGRARGGGGGAAPGRPSEAPGDVAVAGSSVTLVVTACHLLLVPALVRSCLLLQTP